MSRISIDVTKEEHQKLKALAALQGSSLKNFLLSRALEKTGEDDRALGELRSFLRKRAKRVPRGMSKRTVEDIFQQAYREAD